MVILHSQIIKNNIFPKQYSSNHKSNIWLFLLIYPLKAWYNENILLRMSCHPCITVALRPSIKCMCVFRSRVNNLLLFWCSPTMHLTPTWTPAVLQSTPSGTRYNTSLCSSRSRTMCAAWSPTRWSPRCCLTHHAASTRWRTWACWRTSGCAGPASHTARPTAASCSGQRSRHAQ